MQPRESKKRKQPDSPEESISAPDGVNTSATAGTAPENTVSTVQPLSAIKKEGGERAKMTKGGRREGDGGVVNGGDGDGGGEGAGSGGGGRGGGKGQRRSEDDPGPITIDGVMPQKRFYRARAHVNPLSHNNSFNYPNCPEDMDWSVHYPNKPGLKVSIVDVGCGFGGLTVALSALFPDKGVLGMEIRAKVCEFVRLRIEALRQEHPGQYQNVSALRTNSMLLLPHFLARHQLEKMFFCFPDPHFKAKNHRRRIISEPLLTEYAFFLRPGGLLYMITDVNELHQWNVKKAEAHPCFVAVTPEETERDPAAKAMTEVTEEGKKVARMGGEKHWAVFRRIPDEDVPYTLF